MKKLHLLTLSLVFSGSLLAQESIIKKFAEPRRPTEWMNPICLYPSTLRMINLSGDPQFNELVNDIEKILIYTLDSATVATKEHKDWLKDYEAIGYEEYISLMGKQEMLIIGKEDEYVGVMSAEGKAMAIYMRGQIPFAKIPKLLETFRSNDVLPLITDQFK
ncbi:MAG: hypothetical protein RLN88_06815 [Ekhidna sp.]|uniref:hypothetical protein n=1 Tax=Ekhidna sp. TaxID=2608089 RepID=UPI0032EBDF29